MKKIGGCRMDKVNVTAPFATLEVSPEALTLTVDKTFADLMPCGVLTFAPEDVAEVRAVRGFPFLATGVQVRHRRPDAPKAVLFWVLAARPGPLQARIRAAGFVPRAPGSACSPVWRLPLAQQAFLVVWVVALVGMLLIASRILWPVARTLVELLGQI